MLIYIIMFLIFVVTVLIILSKCKQANHPEYDLAGKWFCTYHHPLVWASKQKKSLSQVPQYTVTLFNNGTGFFVNTNSKHQKITYFSWIYEDDYIIADSDNWNKTNPYYFQILELNELECTAKIVTSKKQSEKMPEKALQPSEHFINMLM